MNKVKYYRAKAGLTQRQLSSMTGISRTTISKIERYESYSPKRDNADAIAKCLGVDVYDLFSVFFVREGFEPQTQDEIVKFREKAQEEIDRICA